jgi:hypothetical protein
LAKNRAPSHVKVVFGEGIDPQLSTVAVKFLSEATEEFMVVAMTVLIGAFCTITAVLSMIVSGVSGWAILQIYGVFCLALALKGEAVAVILSHQKSNTAAPLESDELSEELACQFEGRIAVSGP